MSALGFHNPESESQAHVEYLEGRITLQQLEKILHPHDRPMFSRAVLQSLSSELKKQRLAREARLNTAGVTLETATEQYLTGVMTLQKYLVLMHGKSLF